jgi:transcriptional regulator
MYTPAQFKLEHTPDAHALMRAHPFAILVTIAAEGLVGTHLPTVLKVDAANPLGRVECHVARPNPQWRSAHGDALMIFQGPEAYIRPGWYPSKATHGKVVPTWNYAAVHAYGRLEAIEDPAWLLPHVAELTNQQEAPYAMPWATSDAPKGYLTALARGIVGLKFSITRLEAKAKMSQNREAADRAGVVRGLTDRGAGNDSTIAELVAAHKGRA